MRQYSRKIRETTREMRRNGLSLGDISRKSGVSKSTLSLWVRDIPKPLNLNYTNQKEWLKQIRVLAILANKEKRRNVSFQIGFEVKNDLEKWKLGSPEIQKAILAVLYWAEGTKGREIIQFANTDPRLALLFVTLLRNNFSLDESKFRVRLHLHYYHREKEVKKYWSNLLNIPENQFNKTYRKLRSKEKTFRRNTGGICFIKYNSVYLQERIMDYAYLLAEKLTEKIKSP
jgi:transcriptional regulator with XRE-family HTH domain